MFKQWPLEASVTQGSRHRGPEPKHQTAQCTELTIKRLQAGGCLFYSELALTEKEVVRREALAHVQLIKVNSFRKNWFFLSLFLSHTYTRKCIHIYTGMHSDTYAYYKHTITVHSTCAVNHSCKWTRYENTDKPHMYIPVTNPCMQYKHYGCTPQDHNSIYTRTCGKDQFIFSIYYTYCTKPIYVEWNANNGTIFMGMRSHRCKCTHAALFINTQEVGLTLLP